MQFKFSKQRHLKTYLYYTLAFIIVGFFIYATYLVTGHSLIWSADATVQHLPLLQSFRASVANFLHHPFKPIPEWSLKFGLGADTLSIFSYYNIGDLFSYLILLFPASHVVLGYQVIVIFRLYCAGLAFCYFANHFNFNRYVVTGGALVYLFNTFLEYAHLAQPFFTTPFILFPLIICALERVLQGGSKWPLTLMFTWMLISNFYFAYMIGLGALVFVALRYCLTYRKMQPLWTIIKKLAFATIFSVAISAFILIPEIIDVLNSTRSGSEFANGLKLYPLSYYLLLPSQLINGGSNDLLFWSALGFASIVFFAIVYIFSNVKKYKLLSIILSLSFIILLFPYCGAVLNGLMSPSNRWTFMLCFALAFATCILLQNITNIDHKTMRNFVISSTIYGIVVTCIYFIKNNEKLFIPIIFLVVSLSVIYAVNYRKQIKAQKIVLLTILLNIILNGIYFAAPFNNSFSNKMLLRGEYENLQKHRYAGLNEGLKDTNDYRVSTISNAYDMGGNLSFLALANDLHSNVNNIDSFYSLQNHYVGDFMQSMQNIQYLANIPVAQVDDRTVLDNFLGVKYLFGMINQPNSQKIPAGYLPVKATPLISNQYGNSNKNQQTICYQTDYAFPLMYWQDTVINPKQYHKLNATQKERLLAGAVLVPEKVSHGLKQFKDFKSLGEPVRFTVQSNHLDKGLPVNVDPANLRKTDNHETYKIILTYPDRYQDCELHVEFSKLDYQPFKMGTLIAIQKRNKFLQQLQDPAKPVNFNNAYYDMYYLRHNVLTEATDSSYKISLQSSKASEQIKQRHPSSTSFYNLVKDGTVNLGYYEKFPTSIKMDLSKLGTYHLQIKVIAEPLHHHYYQQVKTIQKHALRDLTFNTNEIIGQIKTIKTGILTSSIPYSKGWHATVNGKEVPVLRTNQAFIGLKLKPGTNHIRFTYQTPGLRLGLKISLAALLVLILWKLVELIMTKKEKEVA